MSRHSSASTSTTTACCRPASGKKCSQLRQQSEWSRHLGSRLFTPACARVCRLPCPRLTAIAVRLTPLPPLLLQPLDHTRLRRLAGGEQPQGARHPQRLPGQLGGHDGRRPAPNARLCVLPRVGAGAVRPTRCLRSAVCEGCVLSWGCSPHSLTFSPQFVLLTPSLLQVPRGRPRRQALHGHAAAAAGAAWRRPAALRAALPPVCGRWGGWACAGWGRLCLLSMRFSLYGERQSRAYPPRAVLCVRLLTGCAAVLSVWCRGSGCHASARRPGHPGEGGTWHAHATDPSGGSGGGRPAT